MGYRDGDDKKSSRDKDIILVGDRLNVAEKRQGM